MKVYTVPGTAIEFAENGDEMVSFQGSPDNLVKHMSADSELTAKNVRRIMLKTRVPYVAAVDLTANPLKYGDVSVHTVINLPTEKGLQIADSHLGGPATSGSMREALVAALSLHITTLTGKSVQLVSADLEVPTSTIFRGSNGLSPLTAASEFGDPTA